ncbi:general glycosylation pathway protein [Halomonas sp. M4R1S46]|uniref:general glycosylation pathway protein n=1 Tax=Halomonas sp. M4R1S46 TaxID=2982692 RepID=UPI0021E47640|nr:general glycosylation pathway protein [Halomonas sp. M4R1S46]UYG09325.1 general glycosylation pathway protein [Halomonas sp. M4R1S46]
MNKVKSISDLMGRAVYGLISLSLGIISLTMMGVALWDIWLSVHERTLLVAALLNAIGLIVIGMAVFDVSKFLLEEEVFSSSATKSPAKQREALLKFLVIIAIAISLESLVFVFDAGTKDITTLIYPTFLLISAVLLVVGLGVYQRLTRDDEK